MTGVVKFVEVNQRKGTGRRSWPQHFLRATLVLLAFGAIVSMRANAQVNVTTWHNDIGRTGQNLNETALNTSNVTTSLFGKLFSQPVDGLVYAQPLYLSGVTINGVAHNVVFIATQHDSVYAFDADNNVGSNASPLWQASMLSTTHGALASATTVPSAYLGTDITPEIGITGTPVIDASTNTLYVVSKSLESIGAVQRLHALDVTTGAEKFGGPVAITATAAGTGNGSVNGVLTFDQMWENQRPGLLLLNGIVYVGFASHGDNGPWHGWILGYNAATLAQTGAYCSSANGTGSGFWMSGAGLAADQLDTVNKPFGRMFVASGNGDYNATKPYTNSMDFGDSHLNLDLTNGVPTVTDEFTTNQQALLNSEDGDVGSGGLMVIPTQTTGTYPHLAVQTGKAGTVYLLNRDNLGGYNTTTDQALQEITNGVGDVGSWSTPAYWNGTVYYWGRFDYLKAFKLNNGLLTVGSIQSTEEYGYPGATPSISANGSAQGIVWTIDSEGYANSAPAILQAHDANNIATTLYSSATNATRDKAGTAVKFTVPTIANGKVYVGTATEVDIYGLLNGAAQTKSPAFTPGTESFNGSVSVTLTDSTPNASIYYTTDGTAATTSSTLYTAPITLTTTSTINAVATATGLLVSPQSTATYTNIAQTAAVTFSLAAGSYASTQTLTLSDSTVNAVIYYTLDGSTPTSASTVYSGPITISTTETVSAIAIAPGLANSPVTSAAYTILLGQTGISFGEGFAASAGLINLNGSAQLNDARLQLTDGLGSEAGTAWYMAPVNIQSFTTDFTFQLSNPSADGITFAIQNTPQNIWALGYNGYELGYAPLPNSAAIKFDLYDSAGEGPDSTGLYLNGAVPTVPAVNLTGTGIDLHSDDTMAIHLVYDGTILKMTITDMVTSAVWSTSWTVDLPGTIGSNTAYVGFTGSTGGLTASQKILTWSYVSNTPTATTPTYSVAAGTYTTSQTVTISDTTTGAKIYYTTNGTTPTTTSTLYSGSITVGTTETLNAIAVATGYNNSAVATAAYTIAPLAATPTFSVAAGSYTSAQTVTISDTTSGAKIYYTTNGTAPTTASTLYSGAITVGSTETLSAIAVATGYTNSAVASAAYTITLTAATPTFSLAAGSYTSAQTVTISDTTTGAKIYYTTNGTAPTTASTLYSGAITVGSTETLKAIAVATGYSNSAVASAAYTITLTAATPTFSVAAGSYTSAQTVTISDTTSGARIYYTTNGTTPTTASTLYSAAISVSTTETVKAIAVATGYTNSTVASAAYTIMLTAATPTFSVAAGTYTSAQTVTISDATSGARIYYTTNGTTPTTASTLYSGAITIGSTETLSAIAVATGYTNSAVASAAYTITLTAATPTFSVAAGSYTSAQTVTISDTTSGAKIYYTTNGATPTTASTLYSGAITVSSTETLSAIAVATGYSNSAVASAAYTISAAVAPVVNYAAGFAGANINVYGAKVIGSILQLTDGNGPEGYVAWYNIPVNVQKFTTDFTFSNSNATADGFTFAIQNGGVWDIGSNGFGLGYAGMSSSVAVKFDLYDNAGEGNDSTGIYLNGASPTVPSVDMSASGVNLHSGDQMHAHITYDGTTMTVTITDTVTNASFTTSKAVNIPSTVGGNTAYVGFTAGTGALTAVQNILTWTYTVN
jgi:hypothetical protein